MIGTTKVELKGATFKYIESELFDYLDTLREIALLREDKVFGFTNNEGTKEIRKYISAKSRECIGTKLVAYKKLKRLEELADAIEQVYMSLDSEKQKLMKLKYWTKPQLKTWEGIAAELNVTKRTALRWRNTIVNEIAEKLGER
ncbi:RinA family phage transcriptional regulator [Bacillus cereus HuB4-4]|uniref:RinA family phage transcriptional regulator n=1 Tax=Bacillus cereus HuB4-4 TaxID=1053211 RepID=A0A9W5QSB4_BACCE|nr:RinA family phage transcriptional regulator [Bacillus cereus]EOP85979.1 RinA family phage transcriptional regulator [Bacillus cereus HuB4-4]